MILVTGATGLVGSHLAFELLSSGKKIRATYRSKDSIRKTEDLFSWYGKPELLKNIEWVQADLSDIFALEDALENITEVFHCAALVSFSPSDKELLRQVNAVGTANLVNACLEKNRNIRFIHVSSVAALGKDTSGNTDEVSGMKEPVSKSVYSVTKLMAEREVWRGFEEGLNGFIVNPSVIIGPFDWTLGTSALFRRIDKGLIFYPPGSTGFVGVRDVVKAILWLNEKRVNNESYILNSENLSFQRVLTWIAEELSKPVPSLKINNIMAWIGLVTERLMSVVSGRKVKLSADMIASMMSHATYSSEKIKKLGFEFEPVEEEVKRTAEVFRKSRAAGSDIQSLKAR